MSPRFVRRIVVACSIVVAAGQSAASDVDLNTIIRKGTRPYVNQEVSVSDCVLRIQLRYPGQCRPEALDIGLLGQDIRLDLTEFSDTVRSGTGLTDGIPFVKLTPLRNIDKIFRSAGSLERQLVLSPGNPSKSGTRQDPVDAYLEQQGVSSRVHLLACSGEMFTTAPSGVETRLDVTVEGSAQIMSGLSSHIREFCRSN